MNAQHSSGNDDWLTPLWLVDRVREVLGGIDLDPASSFEANKRIKAKRFYNERMDGLVQRWHGSIFVNPPGGVRAFGKKRSNQVLFWEKLMSAWPVFRHAIFLAFSLESLQSTQRCAAPAMTTFLLCIPDRRIRFDNPNGTPGRSPTHANAIIYVPGSVDRTQSFCESFRDVGALLGPALHLQMRRVPCTPEQEVRNLEELRKQGYSV